jgi:hypothetical protein
MSKPHSGATFVSVISDNTTSGSDTPLTLRSAANRVAVRIPTMATIEMQKQLPKLDDDDDVGIEMEHTVVSDGEPDLKFRGTLLGSIAPEFRQQDRWREYRVYRTKGGTYVFSKIGRSINEDETDRFEAKTWSLGGKGWQKFPRFDGETFLGHQDATLLDALTDFFKFDSLAKQIYAKLDIDAAHHID